MGKKKSDFDFMKKSIGDSGECLADQEDKEIYRFDTGIYALNKIISGSYFQGVRSDKIMALAGLPDTGKCARGDTVIEIRDRETGERYKITMEEFYEMVD